MAHRIDVVVCNLVGEQLELAVVPSRPVHELQVLVAEQWGLPPKCQQLMLDDAFLNADEPLPWKSPNSGFVTPVITCISCYDPLYADLDDKDSSIRQAGVAALAKVGHVDYDRAMGALCTLCVRDPIHALRSAAENALLQVVRAGDERAIVALCQHFERPCNTQERRFFLRALAHILQGEMHEESTSQATWDDGQGVAVTHIFTQMVQASTLAKPEITKCCITALAFCLEDANEQVRGASRDTFCSVVLPSEHAVAAVSQIIRRNRGEFRLCAIDALAHVGRGCNDAIVRLLACVTDKDDRVPQAALSALDRMTPEGVSAATTSCAASVRPRLEDRLRNDSSACSERTSACEMGGEDALASPSFLSASQEFWTRLSGVSGRLQMLWFDRCTPLIRASL